MIDVDPTDPLGARRRTISPSPRVRRQGRVAPYLTRVPGVGWCASAIFEDVVDESEVADDDPR